MKQIGSASIFVLITGVTASIFLGSLVMLTTSQHQAVVRSNAHEQALGVAEAGVYYYRWHLAHDPDDFTDGTGNPGPYVHDYYDPQGVKIGSYSLVIEPPENGSTLTTIKSTGSIDAYPGVKRTIKVTLGIPSMAKYAFLHNSNVFFGSGVQVHGPVMSNGGIRQDGINDSVMQSSLSTYICGQETGCSPSQTKPAIWGSGGPSSLWEFPVPAVDFEAVSLSFNQMREDAQTSGVYLPTSSRLGYHLVFLENGSVNVSEVTQAGTVRGLGYDGYCTNLYQIIRKENFLGNYSLADKQIIFLEDVTWVEGIVNGRVTVVAARFPIDTNSVDMWINGTTRYVSKDGSSALGLISQRNIFFIRDLPDDFEIDAAMMAKNGSVFRHGFHVPGCGNNGNAIRNQFMLYGSIISGQKSAWNWGTPPGSGFVTRVMTHDNHLTLNPPPYFPVNRSEGYEFISWSETDSE